MATLRQIFTKMANDVKKYPNIVQLTKTLDEGFKEVAENISGGGGGGSTVSVTQTQTSGNKIGTITVDGVGTDLYAPKATLSLSGTGNRMLNLNTQVTGSVDVSAVELPVGDTVSYVASQESGTLIGTLTINNVSSLLYAPTPQTPVHTYSTTEHVVGKWIDGTTDVYEITINGTSTVSDGTDVDYDLTALNIDHIVSMQCVIDRNVTGVGAIYYNIPFYEGNDLNAYIRYYEQTKKLSISVKLYSGESTSSQIAVIRYIKTSP